MFFGPGLTLRIIQRTQRHAPDKRFSNLQFLVKVLEESFQGQQQIFKAEFML